MPDAFSVAIIQDSPVFLNLAASVDKACALIRAAGERAARLVVFPETWLPGYPVWLDYAPGAGLWDHAPAKALFAILYENSLRLDGPEIALLGAAARQAGCVVAMGANERAGGTLYNSIVYFQDSGEVAGVHRKLVPTYTERLVWGQGDGSTLTVLDTPYGRLGGLICWEHWMPLARAAMHARHELVHVALWPGVKPMNLLASRHYAFEGQCFVMAAGAVLRRGELFAGLDASETAKRARTLLDEVPGDDARCLLGGGSAIIAPDGECIAGPLGEQPAILTAEIDPVRFVEGRLALDVAGHYSRPDVFRLEVDETPRVNVEFRRSPAG